MATLQATRVNWLHRPEGALHPMGLVGPQEVDLVQMSSPRLDNLLVDTRTTRITKDRVQIFSNPCRTYSHIPCMIFLSKLR